MRSALSHHDWLITVLVILLSIIGGISVFSTTYFPERVVSDDFWQHLFFVGSGLVIYFGLIVQQHINWRSGRVLALVYVANISALLLVLALPSNGPKRWISLGSFTIQPSEFAKLTLVLVTAYIWHRAQTINLKLFQRKLIITPFIQSLIFIAPLLILIWRQPSLGNTLLVGGVFAWMWLGSWQYPAKRLFEIGLAAAWFITLLSLSESSQLQIALAILVPIIFLILSRLNKLTISLVLLISLASGLAFSGTLVWNNLLTDYQRDRFLAFADPVEDPLGSQWQVRQARVAIASGQILGKGFMQGTQINYGLLPYAYTDFAYSGITEQFGMIGSTLTLILLVLLCGRLIAVGNQANNQFTRFVYIGISGILILNTLVHVSMNLGILPVTGVPLPFVSYGGSAILVNFISLGVAQSLIYKSKSANMLGLNSKFAVYSSHEKFTR